MKAVVNQSILPLYAAAGDISGGCSDEALYGMQIFILGDGSKVQNSDAVSSGGELHLPEWVKIRTPYRYEGYVHSDGLLYCSPWYDGLNEEKTRLVEAPFADVLSAPSVASQLLLSLPRGSRLELFEEKEPEKASCTVENAVQMRDGWSCVRLADGRQGYIPSAHLAPYPFCRSEENDFRAAVVRTARKYLGTSYRWGGKTPAGIDCSGLVSMSYLLNGVVIYRDAEIKEGFPIHEISAENVKPADLLFFPGHVALSLGGGRFLHSTGRAGDNGVVTGSLNPEDPDFRADLKAGFLAAGSIF